MNDQANKTPPVKEKAKFDFVAWITSPEAGKALWVLMGAGLAAILLLVFLRPQPLDPNQVILQNEQPLPSESFMPTPEPVNAEPAPAMQQPAPEVPILEEPTPELPVLEQSAPEQPPALQP